MTQLFHTWEYPKNPITYHRDMCSPMFIAASFTTAKSCESTDKWTMKIHYVDTCIYAHTCKIHVYLHICIYTCICVYAYTHVYIVGIYVYLHYIDSLFS